MKQTNLSVEAAAKGSYAGMFSIGVSANSTSSNEVSWIYADFTFYAISTMASQTNFTIAR